MDNSGRVKRSFVMVLIPAGEFVMGSAYGHGDADEFPLHKVWVDDFLIGRCTVTAAEWANFLNENYSEEFFRETRETTVTYYQGRYYPREGCAEYPANGVTWYGAEAFCLWLSDKTGKHYRLPSEAEWEKAARGGLESHRYPWGNDSAVGMAQFQQVFSIPKYTLSPVGSYPPNPFGLYNTAGNVWEWCSDWYDRNYYHSSPEKNPAGPESGTVKVLRGGSWGSMDLQIRCGIRVGEYPEVSESRVGFRLARSI